MFKKHADTPFRNDGHKEQSWTALDSTIFGGVDNTPINGAEIEVASDGTMRLGGIVVTAKGLLIEPGASPDDWKRVGALLRRMQTSIQFLLGDWIASGANVCGDDFERLVIELGYKNKSLYTYKYVAENVPIAIRMETLSYGHHALVAPIKDRDEQKRWLKQADNNGWSVTTMRRKILGLDSTIVEADRIRHTIQREFEQKLKTTKPHEAQQLIATMRAWLDEIERNI